MPYVIAMGALVVISGLIYMFYKKKNSDETKVDPKLDETETKVDLKPSKKLE